MGEGICAVRRGEKWRNLKVRKTGSTGGRIDGFDDLQIGGNAKRCEILVMDAGL